MPLSSDASAAQGTRTGWAGALILLVSLCARHGLAEEALPAPSAAIAAAATPAEPAGATVPVVVNTRKVVLFNAPLLGDSPAERAAMARAAILAAAQGPGPGHVTRVRVDTMVRFDVDNVPVFYLTPEDLRGQRSEVMLEAAAQKAEHRLRLALGEARELSDPRQWAVGAGYALAATVIVLLVMAGVLRGRRHLLLGVERRYARRQPEQPGVSPVRTYASYGHGMIRLLAGALTWVIVLLALDLWATFALRQFAYTRAWGEQSSRWLMDVLAQFAHAAAAAVPGLLIAALIFLIARVATRAIASFMQRVERGELHVAWLDGDTAAPTRRVSNLIVWLFALAMAYPYLPGSGSESFKGVTVLAGLMLSLGASGLVGQAMSGLSLMYSGALRVGEYVKVGDTEGTVTQVGMLATKIQTGMGEEVSLPNTVLISHPVRNFSRLVDGGQFVLHTAVTIGYATPWRQVHAMLLEAARRTPGVARDPAPYVVQTALSDFYVEYRLCARGDRGAPRRRAEALGQLHANIQDVFNENGVQIMSPHYRTDPAQPQVVPPGSWFPNPGTPLQAPGAAGKDSH